MPLTLSATPESYSRILGARYEIQPMFTPYATPKAVNLCPFGRSKDTLSEWNFFAQQTVL